MREQTFHFDVKATREGAPVHYPALPVPGASEATAKAFLESVLKEQGYTDTDVTPARPTERAD